MDIGTAKPLREVLARYPHRLIDIRDPVESYSAAAFRADALAALGEIVKAGRTPLLVGGTMLYYRALIRGLADMPGADPAVRERIAALAGREGWDAVHRRLAEVDPESAARIDPANRQRVQRALEVFLASGRTLSSLHAGQPVRDDLPCRLLQLGLVPADRAALHRRIAERFRAMLAAGFLEEVRALRARGDLDQSLTSVRSVGYRQAWDYLAGRDTLAEMTERAIAATRQLAKRQLTWLRSWEGLRVLPADATDRVKLLDLALKLVDRAQKSEPDEY